MQLRLTYHDRLVEVTETNYWHRLKVLPYLRYAQGIEEVCLRQPFDASYPVPVHQEAFTAVELTAREIHNVFRILDYQMDRMFRPPIVASPMTAELWSAMRAFTKDRKITFVTPKAPPLPAAPESDYFNIYRDLSVTHISEKRDRSFYALGTVFSAPLPAETYNEKILGVKIMKSRRTPEERVPDFVFDHIPLKEMTTQALWERHWNQEADDELAAKRREAKRDIWDEMNRRLDDNHE